MKSDLDARPVYMQRQETIQGHFLICYLAVLLERLLEFKVLESQYPSSQLFKFAEKFNVVKAERKYINVTAHIPIIDAMEQQFSLSLNNYYLSETQIKSILSLKL